MTDHPHALYRFYSDGGQLLYVGITNNPGNRLQQHQQDKPWWHEVAGISVEKHPSREAALAAEARAIAVEHPRYNLSRPSLPGRKNAGAPTPVAVPTKRLVWVCEVCRQPVDDGEGYIHVVYHDINTRQRAKLAYDEAQRVKGSWAPYDLGALRDLPEEAHWAVHHIKCDPDISSGDYVINVERARSHAALLHWTAHLMGKAWIEYTDWDDLIDRMSGVDA